MKTVLQPALTAILLCGLLIPAAATAEQKRATCAVVGVDSGPGVRRNTAALLAARLSTAAVSQPSFEMTPYADAAARLKGKGFDREVYDYPRTAYVMAGRMLGLHYVIYGKAKIEGTSCILSTAIARVWDGEVITTRTTVLEGDLEKVLELIPEQNMLALLHSLREVQTAKPSAPTEAPEKTPVPDSKPQEKKPVEKKPESAKLPPVDPMPEPAPRPPESIATQAATEPLPTVIEPSERDPRAERPDQLQAATADQGGKEPRQPAPPELDLRPADDDTLQRTEVAEAARPTRDEFGMPPARTRQQRPFLEETGTWASLRQSMAGRIEVGLRVSQFSLVEDSMGFLDEFGIPRDTFIGSVNTLSEEQALFPPEPFIHVALNQYIGFELSYSSLEVETETFTGKSDGNLTMSGPIISVIGRYPTRSVFTPYASLGIAIFGAEFDEQAHWALGFAGPEEFIAAGSPSEPFGDRTREMFVDDATGLVLTGGVLWRFAPDWAADGFVRYMDVESSALARSQVRERTTTETSGKFFLENVAFGAGIRYAPQ